LIDKSLYMLLVWNLNPFTVCFQFRDVYSDIFVCTCAIPGAKDGDTATYKIYSCNQNSKLKKTCSLWVQKVKWKMMCRHKILQFIHLFQAEHRTMAVFILAVIVNSYTTGQVRVCVWRCVYFCTVVRLFTRSPKGECNKILIYFHHQNLLGFFQGQPSLWEMALSSIVYFLEILVMWQFCQQQSPL